MRRSIGRKLVPAMLVAIAASAWVAGNAAAATEPVIVGAVSGATSLSGTTSVAVSGNYAFAASYWSGQLNVIDISNPSSPSVVASTSPTSQMIGADNVTIAGIYAFVTSKNQNASTSSNDDGNGNSLTVVNISNPLDPVVVPIPTQNASELFGA